MYKLHFFLLAVGAAICLSFIPMQGRTQAQPLPYLKVGDTIPDAELKILGYHKSNSKISDFKGKLLILDFWSVFCGYCIDELPRLAELQKKLAGKAEIIGIGMDYPSPSSIAEFLTKREKSGKKIELPTAIVSAKDSFIKRFKITSLPYDIWIDENGVIIHITDTGPVTEGNISSIVKGEKLDLVKKWDIRYIHTDEEYIIRGAVGKNKNIIQGSVVTPFIDSLAENGSFGVQYDKSITRLVCMNTPVNELYRRAYAAHYPWVYESNFDRIIIHSSDNVTKLGQESLSRHPSSEELDYYFRKGTFCYELVLPNTYSIKEASQIMIKDLDRAFNCKSQVVDKEMEHYELVKLPEGQKSHKSADKDRFYMFDNDNISELLFHINDDTKALVVNKTGIEKITYGVPRGKTTLTIDLRSIEDYKKVLQKFGYDLIKVKKKIPVLVITDLKNKV